MRGRERKGEEKERRRRKKRETDWSERKIKPLTALYIFVLIISDKKIEIRFIKFMIYHKGNFIYYVSGILCKFINHT